MRANRRTWTETRITVRLQRLYEDEPLRAAVDIRIVLDDRLAFAWD